MSEHQKEPPEPFRCHPNCTWDYLQRVVIENATGMSVGQVVDLVLTVDQAERAEWQRDRPTTDTGRKAAINLALRGVADVDGLFRFNEGTTARILEEAKLHPRTSEVIAAHLAGDAASKISRDLGLGRSTIELILRYIDEKPRQVRPRAASAVTNHAVISLYKDLRHRGHKKIYAEIARRTGITEQQVRDRVHYAREKGEITDPPLDRSNVKRRRPRAAE